MTPWPSTSAVKHLSEHTQLHGYQHPWKQWHTVYLMWGCEKSHQPNICQLDVLDWKNLAHICDKIVSNFVTNHCNDIKASNDLSPSGDFPREPDLNVVDKKHLYQKNIQIYRKIQRKKRKIIKSACNECKYSTKNVIVIFGKTTF